MYQLMISMQIVTSWVAIVAENFIPWPVSFIVGMVLLMALVPTIIDQVSRVRAIRKQRRSHG